MRLVFIIYLAIGTQGVTTSIAGSLPLALNRFLLTHKSDLYKLFFGNPKRIVFWLLSYNLGIFVTLYTLYSLSTLNNWGILQFPYEVTYVVTIAMVIITNSIGLILMIFVLYHIYDSLKLVKKLDQKQMLIERKRIAWVIVCQNIINFFLCALRIISFINVSRNFGGLSTIGCYNTVFNFINYFSWCFQELFVCVDCLMYIFFLTPYREQLFRFF